MPEIAPEPRVLHEMAQGHITICGSRKTSAERILTMIKAERRANIRQHKKRVWIRKWVPPLHVFRNTRTRMLIRAVILNGEMSPRKLKILMTL